MPGSPQQFGDFVRAEHANYQRGVAARGARLAWSREPDPGHYGWQRSAKSFAAMSVAWPWTSSV